MTRMLAQAHASPGETVVVLPYPIFEYLIDRFEIDRVFSGHHPR